MKNLKKIVIKKLIKNKIKIALAESCTGGLLSASITSVPGSSKVLAFSLVTYSNRSKINLLKVPAKMIKKYGAVSKQVCLAMVKNVSKIGESSLSVSITGIAGPSGNTKNKPIGLIYIGIKKGNKIKVKKYLFKNKGRSYIQRTAVNKSLKLILMILK